MLVHIFPHLEKKKKKNAIESPSLSEGHCGKLLDPFEGFYCVSGLHFVF